ncbi:hypothetical protein ACROYT_G001522 [Oculina patagonica]
MAVKQTWTSVLVLNKMYFNMMLSLLCMIILNDKCGVIAKQALAKTSCDVDSALCDGWRQSNSDVFDWTRHTGSTPSANTGPDGDHTSGSGYYMYIEASSPRVPGDNAKLELSVSGNEELSCLEFYFHMYGHGDTMGTLTVFSGNVTVFNASGSHGNIWIGAKRTIYLNKIVSFEGIVGSSYTGDIAIDDVSISNGSCPVDCDFDSGLCDGWRQSNSDVFDWTRHTGSTPTSNTGPDGDHTTGSGYYLYIEASSPRVAGDNAKLELSVSGNGELSCLEFYYHMYGESMGALRVFSRNVTVLDASGSHGQNWIRVKRTIHLNGTVTFEGIVGSSYTGDIAIDDVSISSGSCPVNCDFSSGLCDGWGQSSSDVFDWTRHTGSTPSSNTGPDGDHTSGSGYYLFMETSSPRVPGDNAKLELSVSGNGELSCLEFYYYMYGDTVGTLTVFSGNVTVFNETGNHGQTWIRTKRTIHLNKAVTFEGIVGSSYTGDIAIDDVSISSGSCRSCDLDRGLCYGWRQSNSDVFDWTRHTGSTPSDDTGPDGDHTTGSGHYMFIETSYPRVAGDNAKLELSVSGNGELSCLEFYYYMYGNTVGTLTVFSGNVTVFNETGNRGQDWMEAKRTISLNKTVIFEGVVGSSYTGDIAIDDVSIS